MVTALTLFTAQSEAACLTSYGQHLEHQMYDTLSTSLAQAKSEAEARTAMLGGMLGGLMGGGDKPKAPKAKAGGNKINIVDANVTKQNTPAPANPFQQGMMMGFQQPQQSGWGNPFASMIPSMESFFGGSFFTQVYATNKSEIDQLMPQIESMSDDQILAQMCEICDLDHDELLAQI